MSEGKRAVHDAIRDWLDEGELPICWVLVVDVAGPDDTRYLAHRAGGGIDGSENPMAWAALGMLRASAALAESQVQSYTVDEDEEDDDGSA